MSLTKNELKWATILALTTPPIGAPKPPKPAYLTFYSPDGEFTLRTFNGTCGWNGVIEYSTDGLAWNAWDGSISLSSSGGYLFVRGIGNTKITGDQINTRWVFFGGDIHCLGNIETLLDYSSVDVGNHPTMGDMCFFGLFLGQKIIRAPELPSVVLSSGCYMSMFQGCEKLEIAPELPAINLAEKSYDSMFRNCRNLKIPPRLPATTLAYHCYGFMFCLCTKLNVLPDLPATILPEECYYWMFAGCLSIRLATDSDATYLYPYRIPIVGAGTQSYAALSEMFSGTGGPFTGTPTINTTYYTDHEPV